MVPTAPDWGVMLTNAGAVVVVGLVGVVVVIGGVTGVVGIVGVVVTGVGVVVIGVGVVVIGFGVVVTGVVTVGDVGVVGVAGLGVVVTPPGTVPGRGGVVVLVVLLGFAVVAGAVLAAVFFELLLEPPLQPAAAQTKSIRESVTARRQSREFDRSMRSILSLETRREGRGSVPVHRQSQCRRADGPSTGFLRGREGVGPRIVADPQIPVGRFQVAPAARVRPYGKGHLRKRMGRRRLGWPRRRRSGSEVEPGVARRA